MLVVENLCKKYPSFYLDNVSFSVPKGYITGFIGANGAGKTTTLKSILNIVKPDSGKITALGLDIAENEVEIKQKTGFMLGGADYYPKTKIKTITSVYKRFFKQWEEEKYRYYLSRFNIDETKMISELSSGMKVKLALCYALSHNAELFIFDEPTSGLDPVAREELLDIFREILENGDKSILFSTHITSDLDKCADYIVFIKNGKIIVNCEKDELINNTVMVAGKKEDLTDTLKTQLLGYKINSYGFTGLMKKEYSKLYPDLKTQMPNMEDIMLYYNKEEKFQ